MSPRNDRLHANKRTKTEKIEYFHKFEHHRATVLMKCLLLSNSELKWSKTDHVSKSSISLHKQVDFRSLDNYFAVFEITIWEIDNSTED